jgi:hypothetical protein
MEQNIFLKNAHTAPEDQWETREFSHGLKQPRREADHVVPRLSLSGAVTLFFHIRISLWLAVMGAKPFVFQVVIQKLKDQDI